MYFVSFKVVAVAFKDAIISLKKYFETLQTKVAELQNQSKLVQNQGDESDAGEKKVVISRSSSQQRLVLLFREVSVFLSKSLIF